MNSINDGVIWEPLDTLQGTQTPSSSGSKRPPGTKITTLANSRLAGGKKPLKKRIIVSCSDGETLVKSEEEKKINPNTLYINSCEYLADGKLKELLLYLFSSIEKWGANGENKEGGRERFLKEIDLVILQINLYNQSNWVQKDVQARSSSSISKNNHVDWQKMILEKLHMCELETKVNYLINAKQYQKCLQTLIEYVSFNGYLSPYLFRISTRLLEKYGRYGECLNYINLALENPSAKTIFDNETLCKLVNRKIRALLKCGNYYDAWESVNTISTILKKAELWFTKGYILLKGRQYEKALDCFDKAFAKGFRTERLFALIMRACIHIKNSFQSLDPSIGTPAVSKVQLLAKSLASFGDVTDKFLDRNWVVNNFNNLVPNRLSAIICLELAKYSRSRGDIINALKESQNAFKLVPESDLVLLSLYQDKLKLYECSSVNKVEDLVGLCSKEVGTMLEQIRQKIESDDFKDKLGDLFSDNHPLNVRYHLLYAIANFEAGLWSKYEMDNHSKIDEYNNEGQRVLELIENVLPRNSKVAEIYKKYLVEPDLVEESDFAFIKSAFDF